MILDLLIFSLFVFFILFPLGFLPLKKLTQRLFGWEQVIFSISLGIVFLTVSFFIFSLFHLRTLFYMLLFLFECFVLYFSYVNFSECIKNLKLLVKTFIPILFLSGLSFFLSLTYFQYGNLEKGQLNLYGAHFQDSIWHIAVSQIINEKIPPENPSLSGTTITNYHYFYNILLSITHKITSITLFDLYFRLINPFLILMFLSSVYFFMQRLGVVLHIRIFSVLFTALSSNLYYLISFLYPHAKVTPSVMWIDEFSTKLINPPLLISLIILLLLLYLMVQLYEKFDNKLLLIFGLVSGSLIGFKSFTAVVFLISLCILSFFWFLLKRDHKLNTLFVISIISTLLFTLTYLDLSESFFNFRPFWFIDEMYASPEHLNYSEWILRKNIFVEANNYIRLFIIYLSGISLFLFINFSVKLMAFFSLRNLIKDQKTTISLLLTMSIVGIILPLLFIQKSVAWNSIQFSYVSVFCLSMLLPIAVIKLVKKHSTSLLVNSLLLILLIPGVLYTMRAYINTPIIPKVDDGVVESAVYLKSQTGRGVLLHPQLTSSNLVTAISGKAVYFVQQDTQSGQSIFEIRNQEVKHFFNLSSKKQKLFLRDNNLRYVLAPNTLMQNDNMKEVVRGREVTLFELNK